MYKKIKSLLNTHTVRQSVITSFSTFTTAGLGAVYYLLLARLLGPEKYGLMTLSLQIMLAVTPLADLGTGTAMVRFIGEKTTDYKSFTSVAFRIKLFTGVLSILLLTLGANFISVNLFREPRLATLLPLVGLGVIVIMLFNFSVAILQGLQKFVAWGGVQIGANIIRILLLGVIYVVGLISPSAAILIFIISFIIGFLFSWRWLDKSTITSKVTRNTFEEFWRFNKWTALFTIAASISSRLDSFFTARYLNITQVGIYSLAITMSSFLPQVASALGAVTAPKFSRFSSNKESNIYLKKTLPFALVVSVGVSLLMVPAGLFVVWFTGRDFSSAMTPFIILLISMVIFAGSGPLRDSLLYSYKKPQIFFYAAVIQGFVVSISGIFLIPKYGITGAAISTLLSQVSILIICIFSYIRLNNKK